MAQAFSNAVYVEKIDIAEVLERHIRNFDWRGEQCILDVGCGSGEVTQDMLLPLLPEQATLVNNFINFLLLHYNYNYIHY